MRFRSANGRLFGEMSSGTLVAEKQAGEVLVIETSKYKIEPVDPGKTIYVVGMLPDKTAVVAARFGRVSIYQTW